MPGRTGSRRNRPICLWLGYSPIPWSGASRSSRPTARSGWPTWKHVCETALEAGDSLDARLVLLAIHARLVSTDVMERFGLSADEQD